MKIAQRFTVAAPPTVVWEHFNDVPALARCLPGAAITADKGGGVYAGRVEVKLGPFGAAFDGEAKIVRDEAARSGTVEGRGVDQRGGSRSRLAMAYRVTPEGEGTAVELDADITLAGPIAQFGRGGIVRETAAVLIRQFAGNLEAQINAGRGGEGASAPRPGASPASALAILWAVVKAWIAGLFGRR
jgi:carbon-monoxide dehydrogenase small subunit